MLVDSHCHLDYPDFEAEGVPEVVGRAKAAGVGHFLTICTEIAKFPQILKVAEAFSFIDCTVGTHPHHAADAGEINVSREEIVTLTKNPKVVGIGETGLDYYYDHSPREEQQRVFATHIEAALETDLPLVIHTRDADDDTIRLMTDVGQRKARGVMHCFSGTKYLAEASLDLGFYVSFSGIVTFKKSEELREIARTVPLDRILVETDSPYLAPMPHRGKRNEPAFVVHTAQLVAELKGVSLEDLAAQTTQNFFTLFNKAKK
ncbi:MAG: TatD family hydrolase [Micavibrio sp.]|nr:TatD family hydrolase [Micavibrio sp.]